MQLMTNYETFGRMTHRCSPRHPREEVRVVEVGEIVSARICHGQGTLGGGNSVDSLVWDVFRTSDTKQHLYVHLLRCN